MDDTVTSAADMKCTTAGVTGDLLVDNDPLPNLVGPRKRKGILLVKIIIIKSNAYSLCASGFAL